MKQYFIQIDKDGNIMSATSHSAYCEEVNPSITEEVHVVEYSAVEKLIEAMRKAQKETAHMHSKYAGKMNRFISDAINEFEQGK